MQMDNQFPARKVPRFCSFRYGLSLLLHFCNVVIMAQRMCLSLTMVAMVNSTKPHGLPNTSTVEHLDHIKNPVYNWSPKIQGAIFSSIFCGVLITQIPVGYLSERYSIKKTIGVGLFLSSLLSLLMPMAAGGGEAFLLACRVAQGAAQGSVSIAQHAMWVKWAPPLERGRLTSLSLSGILLGSFIVLLVTGFICQSLGWPMAFYIFGACGCALSLLWFVLFYDDPKDHPCISISEKEYILSSLNQQNGLLSALPYLLAWSFGILSGHLTDFFLSRNLLRLVTIRNLFNTLGLLLPAFFSVCLLYLSFSFSSTAVFLILASSTGTFCMAGVLINGLDIAPSYYGSLKGVTAVIGMIGGLISSSLCGVILNQDPESAWFKIFFLMALINVICLLFCLVFGKAEIQDWATDRQEHTRL
uniref:Solute carrier family 17 member 1 n=1 Tax=Ailuropoda melanoleuca TaxID=9646 RepID=A0A7N5J954_AILME